MAIQGGVEPRVLITDKLARYVPATKRVFDEHGAPTPQTLEQPS
jgi:hypothetical protein